MDIDMLLSQKNMNVPSPTIKSLISIDAFVHDRQRMLDTLLDNLEGLVYCNLYDKYWTMIFVSNGCKELTGYSPEDLVFNKVVSYEEITFKDDREMVRKTIEEAVRLGTRFEVEYRIVHANTDIIWVCGRGHPIYNAQGKVHAIEGFIQNITERKQIEQSLRDTEFRYRSIL